MRKIFFALVFAAATQLSCAGGNEGKEAVAGSEAAEMETGVEAVEEETVEAPEFTLEDINGKQLSLKSLQGKYVILDFWGSWCPWCIKGIPDMNKYYAKYKDKMEILSIDCNDSKEDWKAAVKKYNMPWLHVYNPKMSTLLKEYGIQGFPTKVVVDPKGNVVNVVVGEDPAFYTYLDELFK